MEIFYLEGGEALAQAPHRNCGSSDPGGVQGQTECDPSLPTAGGLELDSP